MNELFVNVKVDREERPDVDARLHGRRRRADRPRRLADDRLPHARRRAVLRRHVLPAGAAPRPARVPPGADGGRRGVPRAAATRSAARRASSSSTCSARATLRPSSDPLTEPCSATRCGTSRAHLRAALGRLRRRAEVPARLDARVPAAHAPALRRRRALAMAARRSTAWRSAACGTLVGGGFHRYSVDAQWLVPHFEKMLYDNALLVSAYPHGWAVTGEPRYREVAERTVEYVLRELSLPEGGFASAQDADTDGVEGLTFTWTAEELPRCSASPRRAAAAVRARPLDHPRRAHRGRARAAARRPRPSARSPAATTRRSRPGTGSCSPRSPTPAAGSAATTGSRAPARARRLPARAALDAGRPPAPHLPARPGAARGRARRLRRRRQRPARAARRRRRPALARGGAPPRAARRRVVRRRPARRLLADARGRRAARARKKHFDDHPTPSGNSMLAFVLLRLARIYGDDELERRAAGVLRLVRDSMARIPTAFGHALCASTSTSRRRASSRSSARGRGGRARRARAAGSRTRRRWSGPARRRRRCSPARARRRPPALYVCERFACQAPVTDPAQLTSRG